MKRRLVVGLIACLAVIAAACGDDGRSSSSDDTSDDTTEDTGDASGTITEFGDLEFPCGPQDGGGELPTGDPVETFGISDAGIAVGTFADPGFESVPGLNQEMFDASTAFVEECNEAGGINGRPIDLTLRDSAILEYVPRVEEACATDFATVGGGATLDDGGAQALTDCGIVNISGFSVTAKASLADNVVQPVPNPPNIKPAAWLIQLRDALENGDIEGLDGDAIKNTGIIFGDLQTTIDVKDQFQSTAEALGYEFVYDASYNIAGEANWAPFASAVADAGVEILTYTGSPDFLIQLQEAMNTAGNAPPIILQEANFYDADYAAGIAELNPDTLNLVRTVFWPFERADENPATQTYLDLMDKHVPDGEIAQLGEQSMSAWLLFAQSAAECDRDNNLSRTCVYDTAKAITSWTGGGLHQETNPNAFTPPECGLILEEVDGAFEIWEPQGDTPEDAFFCPEEDALVEFENTFGEGAVKGGG